MLKHRILTGFALVGFMASVAAAQDVVHLKNGRVLSGSIVFEGDTKIGFTLRRWDTGGEVFVKWTQVPDAEAYRIRTRVAAPTAETATEDLIDAVRIVTNTDRELIGVIQSEKDGLIQIKTLTGIQSTSKTAEVLRETLKVKESEVYTPDERLDRRSQGVADTDFAKLFDLGNFAAAIKVFSRAKDFYGRAEKIAPAERKEELKGLVSAMELRIVEDNAEKALAAIRELAAKLDFQKAIADAGKFLGEFAETSVAKANKNIVAEIETRQKEYQANRDAFLKRDIPDQWARVRENLLTKYAGGKFKLPEAREAIAKMDAEIAAEVGKRLKATEEEVQRHWAARTEKKIRTVSMDNGSWIHRGGQDGGLDYSGSDDDLEDFKKRFGDGQDGKKKPKMGQPLDTSEQWWQNATNRTRKEWLECLYADTSPNVKKEATEEKPCKPCRGQGKRPATRNGKSIEYICHECHGVKIVLTLKYW